MIFFLDLTYAYSNSNLIKRKAIFVHEKLYSYGGHQKHHHNSLDRSNDTQVNTDFKSWNLRPAHERHHHRLRVVSTSFFARFIFILQRRIQDFNFERSGFNLHDVLTLSQ